MKLLTYTYAGNEAVGVLKNDGSEVVPVNYLGWGVADMNEFLSCATPEKLEKLDRNKELMEGIPFSDIKLLAPIPFPRQDVICLGINYYAHAEEAARFHDEAFGGERPVPIYFSKRVNRAVADGEEIDGHFDIVEGWTTKRNLRLLLGRMRKMSRRAMCLNMYSAIRF